MICSTIKGRLQKVLLASEHKQQFLQTLQKLQNKSKPDMLKNKSIMIKKICHKYLKVCNHLINTTTVDDSLAALEFIKLLQLDIYEGKSYELYPIKITSHLLYVKCFDIKIQQKKGSIECDQLRKKKRLYIERLKMFVQEIEESFFYEFLQKDYYANLELIFFLIIRNEMEKLQEQNGPYATTTEGILADIQFTKKYVAKLFELLKSHILELNEMLFYLENKVYELLTAKVKLMIQLFQIQATLHFIEHVGDQFSDRRSTLYNKFFEGSQQKQTKFNIIKKTILNFQENTHKSHLEPSKAIGNIFKQFSSQEETPNENFGQKCKNRANPYETIKSKFFIEQVDLLWEKYDGIFNKIPNSIDQVEIFEKVESIINTFKEKSKSKQKKLIAQIITSKKTTQNEMHGNEEEKDSYFSDSKDFIKNCSNLTTNEKEDFQKLKSHKHESIYKRQKNIQLNDFMSFVKDSKQRETYFTQRGKQNSGNSRNKLVEEPSQRQIHSHLDGFMLKLPNQLSNQKHIQSAQNQDEKNEESSNFSQKIGEIIHEKQNEKEQTKISNFKVIKDMKSIFQFISETKEQNQPKEKFYKNKTQTYFQLKSLLKNNRVIFQNMDQNIQGESFKKLNAVKIPTIKLLQNIKESQFERLRRIKSTDILGGKQKARSSVTSKQSGVSIEKNRSKTVYFPFIKQTSKQEASNVLDLPKTGTISNSKLFIFSNGQVYSQAKKEPLKIKTRSPIKKTTLDLIEQGRMISSYDDKMKRSVEASEFKQSNDRKKKVYEYTQQKFNCEFSPKTCLDIGKEFDNSAQLQKRVSAI